MAVWTFEYSLDFISTQDPTLATWKTIPQSSVPTESFVLSEQLHKGLKPSANSCSFSIIKPSTTILADFISSDNTSKLVALRVKKDSVMMFLGWVDTEVSVQIDYRISDLSIKAVDETSKLDRKISTDPILQQQSKVLKNYYVYDPTHKSTSLLYYILHDLYGLPESRITPLTNYTQIDFFLLSNKSTFSEILSGLLYELGFVYYFDRSGNFCTKDLFPTSLVTVQAFDDTNIWQPLKLQKASRQKDNVKVHWWPHDVLTNTCVFSDNAGGGNGLDSNIAVDQNDWATNHAHWPYYPKDFVPAGSIDPPANAGVNGKYEITDREILFVDETTVTPSVLSESPNLAVYGTPKYYSQQFQYIWKNSSVDIVYHIWRFKLYGTAVVKGNEHWTNVPIVSSQFENDETIETSYITNETAAKRLANGVANYYQYGNITYQIDCDSNFDVGSLITLQDSISGIGMGVGGPLSCRIFMKETSYSTDGVEHHMYSVEGMKEFAISAYTNSQTIIPSSSNLTVPVTSSQLSDVMTHNEAINGFTSDDLKAITIPPRPVMLFTGPIGLRALKVTWDRNEGASHLTNFSNYEIVVSSDGTTWYQPVSGGDVSLPDSWKVGSGKSLNDPSILGIDIIPEVYIHSNLPVILKAGAPVGATPLTWPDGITLQYAVRTVTNDGQKSQWSAMSNNVGKALVAGPGDIAAGTIAADQISANAINANKIQAQAVTAAKIQDGAISNKVIFAAAGNPTSCMSGAWNTVPGEGKSFLQTYNISNGNPIPNNSFIFVAFTAEGGYAMSQKVSGHNYQYNYDIYTSDASAPAVRVVIKDKNNVKTVFPSNGYVISYDHHLTYTMVFIFSDEQAAVPGHDPWIFPTHQQLDSQGNITYSDPYEISIEYARYNYGGSVYTYVINYTGIGNPYWTGGQYGYNSVPILGVRNLVLMMMRK